MLNDDELIEQIKKGNEQAAEELIAITNPSYVIVSGIAPV